MINEDKEILREDSEFTSDDSKPTSGNPAPKDASGDEDSDDFKKYDDTEHSNVDSSDPIAESNASTNDNARNDTPTFTRTYDKNTSDEVDDKDMYDGAVADK